MMAAMDLRYTNCADNASLAGSLFGRTDFAALAEGFGISGKRLTKLANMRDLFTEYQHGSAPTVWDANIRPRSVTCNEKSASCITIHKIGLLKSLTSRREESFCLRFKN